MSNAFAATFGVLFIVLLSFLMPGCGVFLTTYTAEKRNPFPTSTFPNDLTSRDDVHHELGEPFFVNKEWRIEPYKHSGTIA